MLRIKFVKGQYEVEALDEAGHRFLSAYAAAHLSVIKRDVCIVIDTRFLGAFTDAAKEAKLTIARG
jgi:hypothetical protein